MLFYFSVALAGVKLNTLANLLAKWKISHNLITTCPIYFIQNCGYISSCCRDWRLCKEGVFATTQSAIQCHRLCSQQIIVRVPRTSTLWILSTTNIIVARSDEGHDEGWSLGFYCCHRSWNSSTTFQTSHGL